MPEAGPVGPLCDRQAFTRGRFVSLIQAATTTPPASNDEYSDFKPRPFAIDDTRRGVVLNYAPPAKKGSAAHKITTLVPGSLLWHENATDYDLLTWRDETGLGPPQGWRTSHARSISSRLCAIAYAAVLNLIPSKAWRITASAAQCRSGWRAWSLTASRSTPT